MRSMPLDGFIFQEIKTDPVTPAQLEEMKALSGSYEALFSKRSKKYAAMGLKNQKLGEKDFRQLLLDEYTFLKRPVAIVDGNIFIGSSKETLESLKKTLVPIP